MSSQYNNPYKTCREAIGITQEKAAELLDVSVESIRAYEGNKRIPPESVVLNMIDIYHAQHLAGQHLRNASEIARRLMPEVEAKELPEAVLGILAAVNKFVAKRDLLVDITSDGRITSDEMNDWQDILASIDTLRNAALSVRFANVHKEKGGK